MIHKTWKEWSNLKSKSVAPSYLFPLWMNLCGVGASISVELLLRNFAFSLGLLLFLRGLIGFIITLIVVRPTFSQFNPVSKKLFFARLLTGGLTFYSWFGAIKFLTASLTSAMLLLDTIVLSFIRRSYTRKKKQKLYWECYFC